LRRDVLLECERRGLPRPEVEVIEIGTGRRGGVAALLKVEFSVAVSGPLLLGAGSHFGAGLFGAAPRVAAQDLIEGYHAMAADKEYEREAQEWIDGLAADVADEPTE
jgi:hypothetical protein